MADVWQVAADVVGSFRASGSVWRTEGQDSGAIGGPYDMTGYRAWTDVPIPAPEAVISATLTLTRRSGTGYTNPRFYLGPVPPPDHGVPTGTHDRGPGLGNAQTGTTTFDATQELRQALTQGWEAGDSLGLELQRFTVSYTIFDVTLEVQYQMPAQYITGTLGGAVAGGRRPVLRISLTGRPAVAASGGAAGAVMTGGVRRLTVTAGRGVAGGWLPGWIRGVGMAPPITGTPGGATAGGAGGVRLSRTVPVAPPPIPWQRLVASALYRQALDSRQPVTDARVEIINPDGAVIATLGGPDATHPGVVSGSVSCRGDAAIRWECDLTIDNPDLVPESHYDLLHPLSHNAVRVWWRIRLADGTWGEIPVGTYYLDWPDVTDNGDATIGLTVRGSDVVAEVKRARYRDPIDVGGMTASDAVRAILQDRAPWATLAISPSDYRLPEEYEAGEPGGDPIDDVMKIADSAGMRFYADRMGTLVLADDPAPGPPVESFIEGPGCAMTEVSASVNLDDLANSVTVASTVTQDENGNDIEPIVAHTEDDDPTSPLWIGRGRIRHRRFERDDITTQPQADRLADRILDQHRAPVDQVELVLFAHPHLDPWDTVALSTERARVTGARQVQGWSLALGDLSGQRVTAVGRRGLT